MWQVAVINSDSELALLGSSEQRQDLAENWAGGGMPLWPTDDENVAFEAAYEAGIGNKRLAIRTNWARNVRRHSTRIQDVFGCRTGDLRRTTSGRAKSGDAIDTYLPTISWTEVLNCYRTASNTDSANDYKGINTNLCENQGKAYCLNQLDEQVGEIPDGQKQFLNG